MKKRSYIFLFMIGATFVQDALAVDIPPSQNRAGSVAFAKTVIALESSAPPVFDQSAAKNPFNPTEPLPPSKSEDISVPVAPADFAGLEAIAPTVTPSGSIEMGGEPLLLFGQKRLKVGDHLTIIFQGKPYEIQIVRIQSTSFTLRMNGVEVTRPIKSVTKP